MHIHFPDLWIELEQALSVIQEPYDLFVSVTSEAGAAIVQSIRHRHPGSQVHVFPNHGRDILPFMAFAQTGALAGYAAVLKLHTKRSLHTQDGDEWRRQLTDGVLGTPERVASILSAFENDPDLGIVVADGNVFGGESGHWRDTQDAVLRLGGRIGLRHIPDAARFPGGSVYWIRPFLLRTLAGMNVTAEDFELEPIAIDGSAAHAVERLVGVICGDAGMKVSTTSAVLTTRPAQELARVSRARIIAYYLPQFHPIPENNAWWGEGFTEWANVARGKPFFSGHRQPRLPADLGFYDLRVAEVPEAQAALARRYGIEAFCYYYYWFDGRGILRRPLEEMVTSGRPDFPFLICWANEPWTKNWDGGNREVLLPQTYQDGWVETFARDVAPLLLDPRYFRLDGRPVLLVYRVMHIPNRYDAFQRLRAELRRLGVGEVHLGGGWVGFGDDDPLPADPEIVGLDAFFEFPPHRLPAAEISGQMDGLSPVFTGKVYDYDSAISSSLAQIATGETRHHAVMLGWDNTARNMGRAHVFHGATPAKFRRWLRGVLRLSSVRPPSTDRLIFINAWNEWAEGSYLEPDRDFGHGWLEAVASAAAEPLHSGGIELPGLPSPIPDVSDEAWLERMIAKAEGRPQAGDEELPAFPAPAFQSQFVGSTNAHAMREAFNFSRLVKTQAAVHGLMIGRGTRVLDFGCGWGRFLRLWMKDIAPECLHGVDIDPDMIGFCRVSGLPAQLATIPPFGPTALEDGSLDLIFAYSVFSHLAEPAYEAWMAEFGRLLRKGGVAVFTTQARRFLETTVTLRDRPEATLSAWELSLRTAFPDISQTIRCYDQGEFIFAPTGGGEYRPSSFYGEAAIPPAYLKRTAGNFGLHLASFVDDPTECAQAVAVMVKV